MEVQVRHTPSFAVVRCTMAGGEAVRAEAGAMMATSDGVAVEAKMQGGLMKSLKRSMLGGESLFITTYTAPPQGGWVDCAANLPGDAAVRSVGAGRSLNMSRGSFLVAESGVEINTQWGGFQNLVGGEGGFLVHASGEGEVVAACYGALDTITLGPGEKVVVDSGHMANPPSPRWRARIAPRARPVTASASRGSTKPKAFERSRSGRSGSTRLESCSVHS